jgi:hypothetical protein
MRSRAVKPAWLYTTKSAEETKAKSRPGFVNPYNVSRDSPKWFKVHKSSLVE